MQRRKCKFKKKSWRSIQSCKFDFRLAISASKNLLMTIFIRIWCSSVLKLKVFLFLDINQNWELIEEFKNRNDNSKIDQNLSNLLKKNEDRLLIIILILWNIYWFKLFIIFMDHRNVTLSYTISSIYSYSFTMGVAKTWIWIINMCKSTFRMGLALVSNSKYESTPGLTVTWTTMWWDKNDHVRYDAMQKSTDHHFHSHISDEWT